MNRSVLNGIIGILLLSAAGIFIFRIYRQSEVFQEVYYWLGSWPYIFEGIDEGRMHQKLKIQQLNNAIPPLDKIYNASVSAGAELREADIDKCRRYYQLILEDMPQMQEAHVFLGFCEGEADRIPEAFSEFKQGLGSGAGVFWASYNLGVLAMVGGQREAAQTLFLQTAKLPLQEVMKNVLASRLFEQYMQANNITVHKLFDQINEARNEAIGNLKLIQEGQPLASPRLRIF
jgi:tetratricopeptide (TPR) repeat protein